MDALLRRLDAIGEPQPVLRRLQLEVISEAQALAPRRLGHLQRSIVPGEISGTHAIVKVTANYGRYVEEGTGLYGPKKKRIEPGKVMAWKSGGPTGGNVRLSGRSRVKNGKQVAGTVFAWSTEGMKAQPYLLPGAKKAIKSSGLADIIVAQWNEAA